MVKMVTKFRLFLVRYEKMRRALIDDWAARIKALGLTAQDFCEDCEIPHPTFSRWVNYAQRPDDDQILRVEDALKEYERMARIKLRRRSKAAAKHPVDNYVHKDVGATMNKTAGEK